MTTSAERAPISAWREQGIYPYLAHPASSVEAIEREVFHHVAWHVQQHLPGFDAAPMRTRAFQFRLLRQAVECGPESLQALLTEALGLPPIDQEILSTQVNGLNLSSVIQTAHVVTERLRFLDGLETIIFDKALKDHVKEREHLHRIVARNAWLFGEDFALSVDNRSLTEVLRKHKASLGEDTLVDPPVGHVTQQRGIVDLVFSRATRYHQPNTLHHLVVELKRPGVKITHHEFSQIIGYAASICDDERFRNVNTQWRFWVIGDDLGSAAKMMSEPGALPLLGQRMNVSINLMSWAQVIDENRSRLQFLQESLDYHADRRAALQHLRSNYADCLPAEVLEPREPQATWSN